MYAEYFYDLGLNISYISTNISQTNILSDAKDLKAPYYEWKLFQEERQRKDTLLNYNWNECRGIGIILGYGGFAAIDIDGCVNEDVVKLILKFLNLPNDYEWVIKSGSHAGYHILFKTTLPSLESKRVQILDECSYVSPRYKPFDYEFGKKEVNAYYPDDNYELKIDINSFCKIEFKWKGHVVAPPSLHASGQFYEFLHNFPRHEPSFIDFIALSELQILISSNYAYDSSSQGKEALTDEKEMNANGLSLVLDCETNGLPINFNDDFNDTNNWPRLLQLSWLACGRVYKNRESCGHFQDGDLYLINRKTKNIIPKNFSLDANAQMIHGLNDDLLQLIGEDLKSVLMDFINYLKKCKQIIGHNLEYDLNVIKCELVRCGINISGLFEDKELFCTMKASIDMCKIGSEPYKFPTLEELYYKCFNEHIINQHNSISDAFITMKCYNHINSWQTQIGWEKYLESIREQRRIFDDNFEELSNVEKLRLAITESEYFPSYKEEHLSAITLTDLLKLTKEERVALLEKLSSRSSDGHFERWIPILKHMGIAILTKTQIK